LRLNTIPAMLFVATVFALPASAIVTLGQSTQTFGITGLGPNSSGQGQSTIKWGNCAFDGTNTACTLSGTFTGLGAGGTYSIVVTYPGNGAFPFIAITNPGSNIFSLQTVANFSSFVETFAETNGPTLLFNTGVSFSFAAGTTCTGVAPNCLVDAIGQTKGASEIGPIIGNFDTAPSISTPDGVVSASAYGNFLSIAPATWIEIYGSKLTTGVTQTWSGSDFTGVNGVNAPTVLGSSTGLVGTSVTVGGIPAYVYYISPGQVDAQVPSGVPSGLQPVVVTTAGGSSVAYFVQVNAVEPGMLAPVSFLIKGAQNIVALFSNTTIYVLPLNVAGIQTARAKPGDSLTLYGIGFGPVTPVIPAGQTVQALNQIQSTLKVTFAGTPAVVTYQGLAPGYVGLYQFNVTVPAIAASDTVPIVVSLNGTNLPQNLVIAISN
jgi:uncharacterized protein (TIGR03437 family)